MEEFVGISDDIKAKKHKASSQHTKDDEIKIPETDPDEVKISVRHSDDPGSVDSTEKDVPDDFFSPDKYDQKRAALDVADKEPTDLPPRGNPMTKWVVLLIIVLIGLLAWQNYSKITKYLGINNKQNSQENLPQYQSDITGTDYTTQGDASKKAEQPASTDQSTVQNQTPAIDKSKITIEILNGNGVSGSAASVRDQLVTAGFLVDRVANAYNFNYQNSIIYYKSGKDVEAGLIKTTLSNRQCEISNDDSIVGNYDVVVVVGKT